MVILLTSISPTGPVGRRASQPGNTPLGGGSPVERPRRQDCPLTSRSPSMRLRDGLGGSPQDSRPPRSPGRGTWRHWDLAHSWRFAVRGILPVTPPHAAIATNGEPAGHAHRDGARSSAAVEAGAQDARERSPDPSFAPVRHHAARQSCGDSGPGSQFTSCVPPLLDDSMGFPSLGLVSIGCRHLGHGIGPRGPHGEVPTPGPSAWAARRICMRSAPSATAHASGTSS